MTAFADGIGSNVRLIKIMHGITGLLRWSGAAHNSKHNVTQFIYSSHQRPLVTGINFISSPAQLQIATPDNVSRSFSLTIFFRKNSPAL
jgi:hypothetical protein